MGASRSPAAGVGRLELTRMLQPYLERVWLILLLAIVGGGGMWLYASRQPQVYQARATILAEIKSGKILGIEAVAEQSLVQDSMVNTVIQNVTTAVILERVVRTNRLATDPRLLAGLTNVTEEEVVESLRSATKVNLRPKTRLIDVAVESTNAALAARLANSLVREFLRQQSEQQAESSAWGSETLYTEAQRLETKLRDSERRLQEFREKNQIISVEEDQKALSQRLSSLNQQLLDTQSQRQQIERDQGSVGSGRQDLNVLLAIPSVAMDSAVIAARQQYNALQLAFANATNRYKPAHPKYFQAYQQLTNGFRLLVTSANDAVRSLEQRVAAARDAEGRVQRSIQGLEDEIQKVTAMSAEYGRLLRQVETDTALHQSVLKRVKELELTKELVSIPLTLVEGAAEPKKPVRPNRPALVARGLLAGIALALGLIYFLQHADSSLRTVDEAEQRLGLPVLGAIGRDSDSAKGHRRLVMVDDPQGLAAEGFRSLRANAGLLGRREALKVHLLTSAVPSEGKTFCSVNYAATLALLGQRVVLVDLDLRRPAVGNTLGVPATTPGVTTYLVGQGKVDELLLPTRVEGLKVMVAGPLVPNPAEQVAGPHLAELLDELRQKFDAVVVDTAPVNSVSDTLSVVHLAEVVFLVVRSKKTQERAVVRALEQLRRASARVRGVVLNQVPNRGGYGYYYHYYNKDGYQAKGVYGAEERKKG